ncbi:hypothetical protein [Bradyrhizobium elkanii]|uniref:hypothetical protein n=1 Tax=Bradyrhizobium elkanii TaxID=29448 RepID=UPI0027155DE0|nr:hypothetical protein [Bradyrhizobium elkanii]WLB77319.1 hypothetical protein QIH83_23275 [Bradyrhizobium elkanii]
MYTPTPKGVLQPKGLTHEKAARILSGLKEGKTLRLFWVRPDRFRDYCNKNPGYASQALPLSEANAKAARHRKGDALRTTTHCRAGLHRMTEDNVVLDAAHGRRRCLACFRIAKAQATVMRPEVVAAVEQALKGGATVSQIIQGKPVGGGKINRSLRIVDAAILARYRRENPEFDRFVFESTKGNVSRGQRLRYQRARNAEKREEINDYYKIRAMLPTNFPDRDDVVSRIFESLLDGSLRREDVKARVKFFIAEHNRLFPTKFAKFGDSPLLSLDEAMFDDGSATRGDNVTRSLWD